MNGSVVQREHHRPDTVRGADIAFVSWERFPRQSPVGFPPLGPGLVVEVLSPGDRPGEVLAQVGDWLEAGARLTWVIDPERRIARVCCCNEGLKADPSRLRRSG